MHGAVLTEPVAPGSHAGLLFMHADGFGSLDGHAVIAVAAIARERGLLTVPDDVDRFVFDTVAGTVRVTAHAGHGSPRANPLTVSGVPAFVLHPGVEVQAAGRRLRADIAFGGAFYAIVDAESAGVPVDGAHLGDLRRTGMAIREAVDARMAIEHPREPALQGLGGTILTAPPQGAGADLRSVLVLPSGAVDRSPSTTGTSAVMAVLDAMGLLWEGQPFTHEGIVGTTFTGRLTGRTLVGEQPAIVTEVDGSAWITGEQTFVVHDGDPLGGGFSLA